MRSRIWVLVVAAAAVLAFGASCGDDGDDNGAPTNTVRPGANKTFGDPNAPLEIVEYFDYR